MKKLSFLLLLTLLSINTSLSQNFQQKIKGNWSYCNTKTGYSEIEINDSFLRHMTNLNGIPILSLLTIEIKNDKIIINPNNTKITDSIEVKLLSKEKIILNGMSFKGDTLSLLNKELPTHDDNFYCKIEMTPRQYSEYLENRFYTRLIKNRHKCVSPLLEKSKEKIFPMTKENLEFAKKIENYKNDTTRVYTLPYQVDFQILKKGVEKIKKPKIVEIINNDSSQKSLVVLDYYGKCYNDFKFDTEIIKDDVLNIQLSQYDLGCDENCKLRLYISIGIQNFEINRIAINERKIE